MTSRYAALDARGRERFDLRCWERIEEDEERGHCAVLDVRRGGTDAQDL